MYQMVFAESSSAAGGAVGLRRQLAQYVDDEPTAHWNGVGTATEG